MPNELNEINFVPEIPKVFEQKCPNCKQLVRFPDCEKRNGHWRDIAKNYKSILSEVTKELKRMDDWCMTNIDDSYTAAKWRELLDNLREKYGRD